jgi:hypothetical protein
MTESRKALRRESAAPVLFQSVLDSNRVAGDITKYGVYHSIHFRAIPFSNRLKPLETLLPLAPMLRVVVLQPRLRRLFAPFERRSLRRRQIPQPGKIPSPAARLRKLRFESLTFQTA